MNRVVWLTDLHLNFLQPAKIASFLTAVGNTRPDSVLIGGDVGDARDVLWHLKRFAECLSCPIYFVLGNHDFYHDSIDRVRRQVERLCHDETHLHYLTSSGCLELSPKHGLVGHDGWADARYGDYDHSNVMLNDYALIGELAGLDKESRRSLLREYGCQAAAHVREVLSVALDSYPHVFLLTHVPPFREACWHQGRISDDDWLPHFTCKAVGDAIVDVFASRSDRQLTVLCGHSHGRGECCPLANLQVLTGGATYGAPEIQRVFELE